MTTRTQRLQEMAERHFEVEAKYSHGAVNEHPDGCYFCGSHMHRSDCCGSSDRDRYYEDLYPSEVAR